MAEPAPPYALVEGVAATCSHPPGTDAEPTGSARVPLVACADAGATGCTDAGPLAEVVGAVVSAISADIAASQAVLLREVEGLGRTIADARAEIASISVSEITGRHIPAASDELDAIVSHTAEATDTILAACEALDSLMACLGEAEAARLQAATTAIYEACGFQDITGQRITKVVAALKAIDDKVARIIASRQRAQVLAGPGKLASGPQLPGAAMGQADVDQLLASFG